MNNENIQYTHTPDTESPFKQLYGLLLNGIKEFAGAGDYKPKYVYLNDTTSPITEILEVKYELHRNTYNPNQHYIVIWYRTTKDNAQRYASATFEKIEEDKCL